VTWSKHSTVPLLIEIPGNPSRAVLRRFRSEISKLETTSLATPYSRPDNNYLHADGKIQWPTLDRLYELGSYMPTTVKNKLNEHPRS
jgi:hypothetical protein